MMMMMMMMIIIIIIMIIIVIFIKVSQHPCSKIWLKHVTKADFKASFAYLIISITMPDSSALIKFFIDFNAVSNSSKDKIIIDRIECSSSSFGTRRFEEENNDPKKIAKIFFVYRACRRLDCSFIDLL